MTLLAELFPRAFYGTSDVESLEFGLTIQHYNVVIPARRQVVRGELLEKKERNGVLGRDDEILLRAIDFTKPPANSGLRRVTPEFVAPLFAEYELEVESVDSGENQEYAYLANQDIAAMIRQESAYVRTGTTGSEVDRKFRLNIGRLGYNKFWDWSERPFPYLHR